MPPRRGSSARAGAARAVVSSAAPTRPVPTARVVRIIYVSPSVVHARPMFSRLGLLPPPLPAVQVRADPVGRMLWLPALDLDAGREVTRTDLSQGRHFLTTFLAGQRTAGAETAPRRGLDGPGHFAAKISSSPSRSVRTARS